MQLFHYTSKSGLDGIKADGLIQASSSGWYGNGVYLTDLTPDQDRSQVSNVLYRNGGPSNYSKGKLDHYVCLKNVDDSKVQKVRDHVYMIPSEGLILKQFDWNCGENKSWSTVGKLVVVGALAIAAIALFSSDGKRESSKEEDQQGDASSLVRRDMAAPWVVHKLRSLLNSFKLSLALPEHITGTLEVFDNDCDGRVGIWCSRCFVRSCFSLEPSAVAEDVNEKYILSCLEEHVNENMHLSNTPGTELHQEFRNRIKESYGTDAIYFKLDSIINSYQNAHRNKPWIQRLRVDVQENGDNVLYLVLCTRCDSYASSGFLHCRAANDGEDVVSGITEEAIHEEIDKHFERDAFRMHQGPQPY